LRFWQAPNARRNFSRHFRARPLIGCDFILPRVRLAVPYLTGPVHERHALVTTFVTQPAGKQLIDLGFEVTLDKLGDLRTA